MEQLGKLLLIVGLSLAAAGGAIWALAKIGFRGLPGDIIYKSDRFTFAFPIVTCLVLSALLTALLWLWHWLRRG